ncbi:hypothetical protein CEP54_008551 [Fusarium duplospermum]|uniref:Zn(2)-C6 fungal-type domain-containing protein n=1 Tax=Fusarium duplospermum TaxID=1325734 RepID=A0A428PVB2_9HYPO|nr:hypothetical protein CEP54_008551 [Fusarium duplospermum]
MAEIIILYRKKSKTKKKTKEKKKDDMANVWSKRGTNLTSKMCSAMPSTLTTAANSPSQKRPIFTRASRACEKCRRRRVKCDSIKPRCSTCSHFDRRCETSTIPEEGPPHRLRNASKPAVRLKLEAEAMARDPNRRHEIGHAQALAVLALLGMSSGSLEKAWELLGEAISTVSALGLVGRMTQDLALDSRSSLVLHGLLTLETMVAFRLGRLPTLRPQDLPGTELLEEPQPGPSNTLNAFHHLVQVLCILNNRLHASGDRSTRDREALSELRAWFAALPPAYQKISISPTFQLSSTMPTESLNLCLCAMSVYLMLQISSLVSEHCVTVGVPQRFPATCSLLPALLTRVFAFMLVRV